MPQKGDIMIKRNKREGYVSIQGEGTLFTPIRGADPIEELNIRINKKNIIFDRFVDNIWIFAFLSCSKRAFTMTPPL